MRLLVYARHDLIDHAFPAEQPALLLEGSWPATTAAAGRDSLDDAIDGRFVWIDQQAAAWAERLGETPPARQSEPDWPEGDVDWPWPPVSAGYLNALALRYYLVKLLRPVAYLTEVRPLQRGDCVELLAAAGRDEDYAEVLALVSRAAGAECHVHWTATPQTRREAFPPSAPWRTLVAGLSRRLPVPRGEDGSRRRVVLCGSPRLLDPICRELLLRGCRVWWLYDRFAVRSWLRWQAAGVGQLAAQSSRGRENRLTSEVPEPLDCRGVDLAGPIRRWLASRIATHGPRQTRLVEQIDMHFRRLKPDALVLDEDATPLARAAVAMGRQYGVRSWVVQHGVPCCRFGFAPLAADRILAWGRSSRQRLLAWGVRPDQIHITGSPAAERFRVAAPGDSPVLAAVGGTGVWPVLAAEHGQDARATQSASPRRYFGTWRPRILLLATVPPCDDRPDAIALRLTGRTYAQMIHAAFAAVARVPSAEMIVKLHPRCSRDPVVRAQRAEFRGLRCRVVGRGPLEKWLLDVDVVLSCGSTAGIEAALADLPVIQLVSPEASDFLPHEQWGLAGTASSQAQIERLLAWVLGGGWQPGCGAKVQVLAHCERGAAVQIVDQVLAASEPVESAMMDQPSSGQLVA